MRLNAHHALLHPQILLVPYSAHHVATYHAWMQDPDLQAATASEPLTLPEEFEMQRSWREDRDKLTFITCLPVRATDQSSARGSGEASGEHRKKGADLLKAGKCDAPERMVGDVNLFLFPAEEDNDEEGKEEEEEEVVDDQGGEQERNGLQGDLIGELELMIASHAHRRKGYGRNALLIFLSYIIVHWRVIYAEYAGRAAHADRHQRLPPVKSLEGPVPGLKYLRVKIHESNVGSIHLFESIGFEGIREGRANYFGEVELRWQNIEGSGLDRLRKAWQSCAMYYYDGDDNAGEGEVAHH